MEMVFRLSFANVRDIIKYRILCSGGIYWVQVSDNLRGYRPPTAERCSINWEGG